MFTKKSNVLTFIVELAEELVINGTRIVIVLGVAKTGKASSDFLLTLRIILTIASIEHPLVGTAIGITSSSAVGWVTCAARIADLCLVCDH